MKQYKSVQLSLRDLARVDETINHCAREGWIVEQVIPLVSTHLAGVPVTDAAIFLLSREIPPPSATLPRAPQFAAATGTGGVQAKR